MAVTAKWYAQSMNTALNKEWQWTGGTINALMTTSTYTPATTDKYKDVVTAIATNEVSGTGYTAAGSQLLSRTLSTSGTVTTVSAAGTITWTSATITNARYAVVYDNAPASNKPLIVYVDFGGNQSTSGGDFSIVWNASGIAQVAVAP